jgi:hypothetical protein
MTPAQDKTARKGNPSVNGENGRGTNGRFAKGNKGGPGNPHVQQTAQLRSALLGAVTPERIVNVIQALMDRAEKGDVPAARELFDRLFGKASQPIEVSGPNGQPVQGEVVYRFNHDRFRELFERARFAGTEAESN